MAERIYELKLTELPVPDGEIDVRDLVAILEPLRLAAVRVARLVGGSAHSGRTSASFDSAGVLRFKAVGTGSTVLEFALGDPQTLPGMPDENLIADRFEELVSAVVSGQRPTWTTPSIAGACRRFSAALRTCGADEFALTRTDIHRRVIARACTDAINSDSWLVEPDETGIVTVSGHLEMVDIRQGHFRIRDDVGNDIHLVDVVDPIEASSLVGQRVLATAVGERDARGRLRLVGPSIEAHHFPAEWFSPPVASDTSGTPVSDIPHIDVSEDEIEEFLSEIRS